MYLMPHTRMHAHMYKGEIKMTVDHNPFTVMKLAGLIIAVVYT